jgi:hypothetical protein
MLQISLAAYVVGSMFLNTAYSELLYQIVAMSVSLQVIAARAARSEAAEPSAALPVREDEEAWWKRPLPAPAAITRRA